MTALSSDVRATSTNSRRLAVPILDYMEFAASNPGAAVPRLFRPVCVAWLSRKLWRRPPATRQASKTLASLKEKRLKRDGSGRRSARRRHHPRSSAATGHSASDHRRHKFARRLTARFRRQRLDESFSEIETRKASLLRARTLQRRNTIIDKFHAPDQNAVLPTP